MKEGRRKERMKGGEQRKLFSVTKTIKKLSEERFHVFDFIV